MICPALLSPPTVYDILYPPSPACVQDRQKHSNSHPAREARPSQRATTTLPSFVVLGGCCGYVRQSQLASQSESVADRAACPGIRRSGEHEGGQVTDFPSASQRGAGVSVCYTVLYRLLRLPIHVQLSSCPSCFSVTCIHTGFCCCEFSPRWRGQHRA